MVRLSVLVAIFSNFFPCDCHHKVKHRFTIAIEETGF